MNGPKHLGVELDNEEAQDVINALQDLTDLQEKDIERLAAALKAAEDAINGVLIYQGHALSAPMKQAPNNASVFARAALREAGVTDA